MLPNFQSEEDEIMSTKGTFSFGGEDANTCLYCNKELTNKEVAFNPFSMMQSMFCDAECKSKFDENHKL